ncbi:anti-sigma factor RsbA family regulatory protein [Pseudonocardia bannensis]|uniref:Sensor histidine kinase n=1 Tax=Pseudonocardia bannensis TaxID=630973 RepID=A0A848DI56_9PSEU|nr:sensor histidine kinase [Pseudonocardia bannensis]NMH92235.1 sensor histidine kinase [Pseudonocardia bannensis]
MRRRTADLLADHTARGAAQIRVVGDVPHPGSGVSWEEWARYEAAVHHAFDDFPIWGMCPYDTRTAPPEVLADVQRTHPRIVTADGEHLINPDFEDPVGFLGTRPTMPFPVEPGPPVLDLADPTPSGARRAVRDVAAASLLTPDQVDDLVIAASEAVNNAMRHGAPPIRLRVWNCGRRVVAAVTDAGGGPKDPYAGLLPAKESATAGLRLWMTHQICNEVTVHREDEGFTIRMVVGKPGISA